MGSAPIILDKSAFQALSRRELIVLQHYFIHSPPPILINEIVADLAKQFKGAPSEEKVGQLTRKFGGSGGPIQMSYRTLLRASLDQARVPMTGQAIPHNMSVVPTPDGPAGYIGISEINWLILRLSKEQVTDEDREFAAEWRRGSANLSISKLNDYLRKKHIIVPRAENPAELQSVVHDLLRQPSLQDAWFKWLLQHEPNASLSATHDHRWNGSAKQLESFAPYAYHCLAVLLLLAVARRFGLLKKPKSTDLLDLQYLYHAPFCLFFVSGDRVHKLLGPLVMREYQRFIPLVDFKSALGSIADDFDKITDYEAQKEELHELRRRPPAGNTLREIWDEVWPNWGKTNA